MLVPDIQTKPPVINHNILLYQTLKSQDAGSVQILYTSRIKKDLLSEIRVSVIGHIFCLCSGLNLLLSVL